MNNSGFGSFMDAAWPFLAFILAVLGIAALVVLIVILVRVARTVDNVNSLVETADKELTPAIKKVDPLMERAELTVDTVNLELLRVDSILEDVESVSSIAGKTAQTVDTVTSAPTELVAGVVEKISGLLGTKSKHSASKTSRLVYPIGKGKDNGSAE